ncbi:MAG: excinuclease ABC subunit A, partial [Akkermansiaceae bacterium]
MPAKKKSTTRKSSKKSPRLSSSIHIQGAKQHNLKNLNLDIPLGELTVVTGPSGSGKSSLAFHTLYAEGQRRYVETFSPYVRQFLDRMDKPLVDRIDGIPPAIAVEQKNNIRTTRSTVGTLTELNDYLKIIFPHLATAYHPRTGKEIKPDTPDSITTWCLQNLPADQALVTFPLPVPKNINSAEFFNMLSQQGYLRILLGGEILRTDTDQPPAKLPRTIQIIQDRVKVSSRNKSRLREAIEVSLKHGKGNVEIANPSLSSTKFSASWEPLFPPTASHFSFNSPIGACPNCRGFGRVIGIDLMKAIPNAGLSIKEGCIAPFQTQRGAECQQDLIRCAKQEGISLDTPFYNLLDHEQQWILHGERADAEDAWQNGEWYGVKGFFDWMETKAYKMHVRVFLSRYRDYTACPDCQGTRLKPESLCFKINGKTLPDLWQLPIDELHDWFKTLKPNKSKHNTSLSHALTEINSRLGYLLDVGLPYLTLDRPARTLSGGEIERVNLTTCLGAALTNTLFVLDEPTVGLHQSDILKLVSVVQGLRDKGNTVVVVEHDETFMRAADHLIDLGPAAGEHGGEITYQGAITKNKKATSLTLDYLHGTREIQAPKKRRKPAGHIKITGASKHNIRNQSIGALGIFVGTPV